MGLTDDEPDVLRARLLLGHPVRHYRARRACPHKRLKVSTGGWAGGECATMAIARCDARAVGAMYGKRARTDRLR